MQKYISRFSTKAGSDRKAIKATCDVIIEINECGDSIETEDESTK